MAVVQYLIDESSATIGKDGVEATDVFLVTDLSGPPAARNWQAMLQGGIPQRGDRHPSIPGIFVETVSSRPVPDSPKQFKVVTVSRRPVVDDTDQQDEGQLDEQDFGVLEFFYVSREEQTQFDADGDQITVTHTYADDDPHKRGGLTVTQGGSVSIQTWQQGFRFTRRESKSPASLQSAFGTKLNNFRWNGYPEKTVMCVGIDGRTDDGGITWTVNYHFMLDPAGLWQKSVIFADPEEGGAPPKGITRKSAAVKTLDVYTTANFDALRINLSRLRKSSAATPNIAQIPLAQFQ